ncbi:galactokinase [Shewanella dokdonensis]|uniref:Galactokinase n=1 Tax=Shewanella dokdonensis TaxID=712036 RepID=A0ABX8DHI6_9GAMM|nr:galactokinase [Shewanella dokdonensis]MCL1074939.1 galactokinase [Shewanella dokdonensis]QVK23382.1 galactokinase [Shewanella dokdonensis]
MSLTVAELHQLFSSQFTATADYHFRAPGRVNLIGEHTDYNDGFVLPCAINFDTHVLARKNGLNVIRVVAADYDNQLDEIPLATAIAHHADYQWANYVRGVVQSLQRQNISLVGCDLAISGNVPQGAGLSSSAALEVALGLTFTTLAEQPMSLSQIALTGQQAENHFVGCNSGIMDQLISAQGQAGNAVLIDCRSLECHAVAMPQELAVVIINSNVKRGLVGSEYNTRRAQCEAGAAHYGVKALRDLDTAAISNIFDELDEVTARRVRHVVTENARTLAAAKALASDDISTLSQLMAQSHASMRDDFAITVPPIDYLVSLVDSIIGNRGGVRMTGGGFGGCVVALVPHDLVAEVKAQIAANYPEHSGLVADVFVCQPSAGAEIVAQP